MKILVNFESATEREHEILMIDASAFDLNNPEHILVKNAVDRALADSHKQVIIESPVFEIIANALENKEKYITSNLKKKTIGESIHMYY